MLSKVQVLRPGDTEFLPGEPVDRLRLRKINEALVAEGKQPATAVDVLLGVTKASLSTDSFLSAASFQHTIKVLAGAAIEGKEDHLYGLKENVIIGKLIPAGTGLAKRKELARRKAAGLMMPLEMMSAEALADDRTSTLAAMAGDGHGLRDELADDVVDVEAEGQDDEEENEPVEDDESSEVSLDQVREEEDADDDEEGDQE